MINSPAVRARLKDRREVLSLIILVLVAACCTERMQAGNQSLLRERNGEPSQAATASAGNPALSKGKWEPGRSFAGLVKRLKPAVVNIYSTQVVKRRSFFFHRSPRRRDPFGGRDPFEEFFRHFFGEGPERERERTFKHQSLGSGFIISQDGYILTNNHVVEHADEIKVKLIDGRELEAKVKGRDPKTDIALLTVETDKGLPTVFLGDSNSLEVGDWVLAIGNPFGLDHTVTAGIVSAKERQIGQGPYDDFIQTDASINPGNSGGPLFNTRGEVVGINTAIRGINTGIGFALPINLAKEILPDLKEKGRVTSRGWLGVSIQEVSPELAESFGLKEPHGALVAQVFKDSPAEKAGLKEGDVIVEFEGGKIDQSHHLPREVARVKPGTEAKVVVVRDGKRKTFKVKLGEREAGEKMARGGLEEGTGERVSGDPLGISVHEITPDVARQLGIDEGSDGVVVTNVEGNGPSADDLRSGDIILEINRQEVKGLDDYRRLVGQIKPGQTALLRIRRGEQALYLAVKLEG